MSYRKKWKPDQEQVEKWLKDCEQFKKDISEIEEKAGIFIKVSKKCQSIYFNWKGINYRISTHHKPDWLDRFEGVEKVTNSRKNIIKNVKKILEIE